MLRYLWIYLMLSLCLFTSCVEDINLDQSEDIILSPVVELDLIFFDLEAANLVNPTTGEVFTAIQDTTRLEFLDDNFIRDNLIQVDFVFEFENSMSQSFSGEAVFINEVDEPQYSIPIEIAGGQGNSTPTTITQTLTQDEILLLSNSNLLAISLMLNENGSPITGNLVLESKATYYLIFNE